MRYGPRPAVQDSDKTEQLVRVAKENAGVVYAMVGEHARKR